MEPPMGIWASIWNFICFLPFFVGLLILGFIKGTVLCPVICFIMTIGNSAIILGLWPVHCLWTYYCILRTKQLGPILKIVICVCITIPLLLWPAIGIVGSAIGGAAYGLLSPVFATFVAVGEGKTDRLFHCFCDGTWDTVTRCCTIVRDFGDVCYHSYFSIMDDLKFQGPQEGKYYEIRLRYLPGAIVIGALGLLVDSLIISFVALYKFPYMLFRGWHRLFQDCIGREGPFLETVCVPFAGLAILLWPLAAAGALFCSVVASIFLGAYAAVIVYQESSLWFGLCYIIATLSIYDEYSNDILDMPEGSCFPRPRYRKKALIRSTSRATSFSKAGSIRHPPSRLGSLRSPLIEVKPLELIDNLIKECQVYGESMVSEGLITLQDIEEARANKDDGKSLCTGLAAYVILQSLLRSAKANSPGILLADNVTELTSTNRPIDTFFDWFLNPLLIIKDQIKAQNLSEAEEEYLGKLVLLIDNPKKLKGCTVGSAPQSEIKQAELDGLARRLQGITKSISRYPTYRRHFDNAMKTLSEDLARKSDTGKQNAGPQTISRSRSVFGRVFGRVLSYRSKTLGADLEAQPAVEKELGTK